MTFEILQNILKTLKQCTKTAFNYLDWWLEAQHNIIKDLALLHIGTKKSNQF